MNLRTFHEIAAEAGLPVGDYAEWVRTYGENTELWPITKAGEPIGGVLFHGHTLHIAIRPQWRGRWVTKAMFRAARDEWKNIVPLQAPIRRDNTRAIRIAESVGFKLKADQGLYLLYERLPDEQQSH